MFGKGILREVQGLGGVLLSCCWSVCHQQCSIPTLQVLLVFQKILLHCSLCLRFTWTPYTGKYLFCNLILFPCNKIAWTWGLWNNQRTTDGLKYLSISNDKACLKNIILRCKKSYKMSSSQGTNQPRALILVGELKCGIYLFLLSIPFCATWLGVCVLIIFLCIAHSHNFLTFVEGECEVFRG